MDILITCYFSSRIDPMSDRIERLTPNGHIKNNNFKLIKKYYKSVKSCNLNCVIFHDQLKDDFVSKYETDKIKFIKWDLSKYKHKSLNDIRFYVYHEYLTQEIEKGTKFGKICITDCFDVVIIKSPFDIMTDNDKLYTCEDRQINNKDTLKTSTWILERYKKAFGKNLKKCEDLHPYLNERPLNAGAFASSANNIYKLLTDMKELFNRAEPSVNSNMAVYNVAAFKMFNPTKTKIHRGAPFTTEFKLKQIKRTDCCIRHK